MSVGPILDLERTRSTHHWRPLENGTYAGEIAKAEGLRGSIVPSEPQPRS